MSENLYSWEFNDKKKRGQLWYIIAISIIIWTTIWWFLTKQYWLSFIVLLIGWLYYFNENNSQDIIKIQLLDIWIKINWIFYDYSSIDNYSIIYKEENPLLLRLYLNKRGLRNIDIKINRKNIIQIKNILSNYIEESEKWELTISEKMINLLKL
jgi:signal transduction histidine kinase